MYVEFSNVGPRWSFLPMRDGVEVMRYALPWNNHSGFHKRGDAVGKARLQFPGARLLRREGKGWEAMD